MRIGVHGEITAVQARELAAREIAEIVAGSDPAARREAERKRLTMAEFAERYLEEYAGPRKGCVER